MVYLTDDLSLLLGQEEMTILRIYPASVSDVEKLFKEHEWENCISNKFTAKRLSKLLNREIEPCPMERCINMDKVTIIFFPDMCKFKDYLPWMSLEMSAEQYRHPKFGVIELVPRAYE
jgi:hypothetical protein